VFDGLKKKKTTKKTLSVGIYVLHSHQQQQKNTTKNTSSDEENECKTKNAF
jgi:hypothetical protein